MSLGLYLISAFIGAEISYIIILIFRFINLSLNGIQIAFLFLLVIITSIIIFLVIQLITYTKIIKILMIRNPNELVLIDMCPTPGKKRFYMTCLPGL